MLMVALRAQSSPFLNVLKCAEKGSIWTKIMIVFTPLQQPLLKTKVKLSCLIVDEMLCSTTEKHQIKLSKDLVQVCRISQS